jgi:putative ABC transport system substrate-binding protein
MDRRAFLAGTVGVLAAPLAAEAQPAGRVWRIGVLLTRDVRGGPEAFRQRLRDLGYFEGQNIAIEWRRADRGYDQLPDLAAELVRLRPDVIVADVTPAIHAAMRATTTVPIVMALAADPVGNGLVSNLARPGGNVTGISLMLPDVGAKRLQLLKDTLPNVSRVAVLWNPSIPWHKLLLHELEAAARSLGLQLLPIAVEAPGEFELSPE